MNELQQRLLGANEFFRTVSFSRLVTDGVMSDEQARALTEALHARKTIVVAGPFGSGKTTLMQALANEQATLLPDSFVALIEDPEELQCAMPNQTRYVVSEELPALHRMRRAATDGARRIVFGEVREGTDLGVFLDCVACGVSGATTLYAKSLGEVFERLTTLLKSDGAVQRELLDLIDIVVFMSEGSIRVESIVSGRDLAGR